MKTIKVVAFDADDTLWNNESFFQEVESKYTTLLSPYGDPQTVSSELFQTEMNNLEYFGYGAKGFTLSMIETALRISHQEVSPGVIEKILLLGKSLLDMPIVLLPGIEETLQKVKQSDQRYQLVVATKGDLLDQQRKLMRSGLSDYFDHIEIMSDKTEQAYRQLLTVLHITPKEFLMVGNSLKSDIQPVLAIGGYAVHIPFEVTWKHEEVIETFAHTRLRKIDNLKKLPELIETIEG